MKSTIPRLSFFLWLFSFRTHAWLTRTTSFSRETRLLAASMSSSSSSSTYSPATTELSLPAQAAFQNSSSPILLFDGVCHFCHAGVHFCLDHSHDLRFCSLQSETGKALLMQAGREPDDYSSMVLCYPSGVAYVESEAVLRVAGLLEELPVAVRWMATFLRLFVPSVLRDPVYHFVSKHRHEFMGTQDGPSCRLDVDESRFVWDPEVAEQQQQQ